MNTDLRLDDRQSLVAITTDHDYHWLGWHWGNDSEAQHRDNARKMILNFQASSLQSMPHSRFLECCSCVSGLIRLTFTHNISCHKRLKKVCWKGKVGGMKAYAEEIQNSSERRKDARVTRKLRIRIKRQSFEGKVAALSDGYVSESSMCISGKMAAGTELDSRSKALTEPSEPMSSLYLLVDVTPMSDTAEGKSSLLCFDTTA
eukprot:g3836.t1